MEHSPKTIQELIEKEKASFWHSKWCTILICFLIVLFVLFLTVGPVLVGSVLV